MMMLQHLPVVPASVPNSVTSVIYRHDSSEHEIHRTYHSRSSSPVHTAYVNRDRSPVIIKRTHSIEDLKHYHNAQHHHHLLSSRDDMVDSDGDHHRIVSRHSEPAMHRRYLIRHIEDEMGNEDEYERNSVPLREERELSEEGQKRRDRNGRYVVYEEEVVVQERIKREQSVDAGVEENEEDHDPDAPLDLSMKFKRNSTSDNCESGSDSESDSSRAGQQRSSAYKKSLMKRYCE